MYYRQSCEKESTASFNNKLLFIRGIFKKHIWSSAGLKIKLIQCQMNKGEEN